MQVDGTLAGEFPSAKALCDVMEGDIALHVAALAPACVFIHAGVVAWRGRAILLPGRSMTGKSTLVAALVARGARYYSDEYAVLTPDGLVHPYGRPMSLRRAGKPPRRYRPAGQGRRALPPGWVVETRFEPGRAELERAVLTPGRTALLLLDNAVAARLAPARVLSVVRAVAARAVGWSVVRGDARTSAPQLLRDCNTESRMIFSRRRERVHS